MRQRRRTVLAAASILFGIMVSSPCVSGEEPRKEGGWLYEKDRQAGVTVYTMEMTLHPKVESRPALKYRLIPDDFDMEEGNAAIHYLKAAGFLEQSNAQKRISEIHADAARLAREQEKSPQQIPPHVWQTMPPGELPLDEVKEYLKLTSFQAPFIEEGAQQRRFDLNRDIHELDNPLGYLIPEIQAMREVARLQHLRCKVAIAENRVEDAITLLGQQYAMGRHLGQDDFIVSALVGISFAGLAWPDALSLVQLEDTPNLYWAFASAPRPMVDMSHAMAMERQLLFQQLKPLQEVDEKLRPAGYWQNFVDRLIPYVRGYSREIGVSWLKGDQETARAAMVTFIAGAYPSAKRYLVEDCGMDNEKVVAYPTAQTVFLAIVRYYEEARDSYFKWTHLPYHQAFAATQGGAFEHFATLSGNDAGWIAAPEAIMRPVPHVFRAATARIDQTLAMLQTVEAIRMYGAANDGKLPNALADLPLPVPVEPVTGKPLDYRCFENHAVLTGHDLPGIRYRLVLRFAK